MGNINILEILKVGLPGLVFLLSLLSYRLLSTEQGKPSPNQNILGCIKAFMFVNFFLAILTATSPVLDRLIDRNKENISFSVEAKIGGGNIKQGVAAVCQSMSDNINKYLLVNDKSKGTMVQVFTKSIIPCSNESKPSILLSKPDALDLGWMEGAVKIVEVVSAPPGLKFDII